MPVFLSLLSQHDHPLGSGVSYGRLRVADYGSQDLCCCEGVESLLRRWDRPEGRELDRSFAELAGRFDGWRGRTPGSPALSCGRPAENAARGSGLTLHVAGASAGAGARTVGTARRVAS